MTELDRKNRLKELIKACAKRIEKLDMQINAMWDYKKCKPKIGFEDDISFLKKELAEEEIVLDTYQFISYELDF